MLTIEELSRRQALAEIDTREKERFRQLTEEGVPLEQQLLIVKNEFRAEIMPIFMQSISPPPHVTS